MDGDKKNLKRNMPSTKIYNTRSRAKQSSAEKPAEEASPPKKVAIKNGVAKWTCIACKFQNGLRKKKCEICSTTRQGGHGDNIHLAESTLKQNIDASAWKCYGCMFLNISDATMCIACKATKQPQKSLPLLGIGASMAIPFAAKPTPTQFATKSSCDGYIGDQQNSKWNCTSCTLENDALQRNCEICYAQRPDVAAHKDIISFSVPPAVAVKSSGKSATSSVSSTVPSTSSDQTIFLGLPNANQSQVSTLPSSDIGAATMLFDGQPEKPQQNSNWNCAACTFENNDTQDKCEICDTGRPGGAVCKKDDSDELFRALATLLPALPFEISDSTAILTKDFEVFRDRLNNSPRTTDEGILFRRMCIEMGAMHVVLNCLGKSTHQSEVYQLSGIPINDSENQSGPSSTVTAKAVKAASTKSPVYWAKGTGFGTGSTNQLWNAKQALYLQKTEEDRVIVLLEVLSSYVNPNGSYLTNDQPSDKPYELMPIFYDLLQQSCLIPALKSYLRNDSVLDIRRHIPLYRAIMHLLRSIALSNQLVTLLLPKESDGGTRSIVALLLHMKTCVNTYASRLKLVPESKSNCTHVAHDFVLDGGDDEGLALLIPVIQDTTDLVQKCTKIEAVNNSIIAGPLSSSVEFRYLELMKALQFGTAEMIAASENGYRFLVSHHFEAKVRAAGDQSRAARVKRLAQESVTLSTSLPLSFSSSVFVRCDNDRLDVMKVLITGPDDTPYANGCFEFDVYFPLDYPNSPMMINLETNGRSSVRFNPNLYIDGKVCLSVLNTWNGRPEEQWNAQTSSFLQVLVSIQSLILVAEPYFNEPGFEHSRGKPTGTRSSREYNCNIYQATVRWAMIEQIKNPCPCFKEIIHTHFWLKRQDICIQIEEWLKNLSKYLKNPLIASGAQELQRLYKQLRVELAKLPVPQGLEDLNSPFAA